MRCNGCLLIIFQFFFLFYLTLFNIGEAGSMVRELEIPPGEELMVKWNSEATAWEILSPPDRLELLPDRALDALMRCPERLRRELRERLVDLLYDVMPDGKYTDFAFAGISEKNKICLILKRESGETEAYREVDGRRVDLPEAVDFENFDNRRYMPDREPLEEGRRQYKLNGEGRLSYREKLCGEFVDFSRVRTDTEPLRVDYCAVPYGYGEGSVIVGDQTGDIRAFQILKSGEPAAGEDENLKSGGLNPAPAAADLDGDGRFEVLTGYRDGSLGWIIRENAVSGGGIEEIDVGDYAVPCFHDVDGDGTEDLVVSADTGEIFWFQGIEEKDGWRVGEQRQWDPPFQGENEEADRYTGRSVAVRFYDVDRDGEDDLIAGTASGELKVFEGPEWLETMEPIKYRPLRQYAAPAWVTVDGKECMIIGDRDGRIGQYEEKEGLWLSSSPWEFIPTRAAAKPDDYYERYYREWTEFRIPSDQKSVESYCDVILRAPEELLDEVVFTVVNIPTEKLRTMARLESAGILLDNAREIYRIADKLDYIRIKEDKKNSVTTLEYAADDGEWQEMPSSIYYWWVVHPITLYEIPAKVNISFWDREPEHYGMEVEDWRQHDPGFDLYRPSAEAEFWRSMLPYDRRYGSSLLDFVENCKTLREALYSFNDWANRNAMHGFMDFGYTTADLQPLVIYAKHYGSCGEQATLAAAALRSILVPTSYVHAGGEDHAWNEWWMDGEWHHLDINFQPADVGHNWGWREKIDHSAPVSIVVRQRGDGAFFPATDEVLNPPGSDYTKTGKGYTDVGTVEITVTDNEKRPVEAAMIVVRSQNRNSRDIAMIDYTDVQGKCLLKMGEQINGGYTFEVVSSAGMTGITDFYLEEGEFRELLLELPGSVPVKPDVIETSFEMDDFSGPRMKFKVKRAHLRPPNFNTCRRGSVHSTFYDKTGYSGTRWYKHYLRTLPLVEIRDHEFTAVGREGVIPFSAEDYYVLSVPGGCRTGAVVEIDLPVEEKTEKQPENSTLQPAMKYENYEIKQDDPDTPLPESSFMLGPFSLPQNERFFQITTYGKTKGLDLDLFLFQDKNGNLSIDGMDEKIADSTTPTASEKITINDPGNRVFWIYGQGWSVPGELAERTDGEESLERSEKIELLRKGEKSKSARTAKADFFLSAEPIMPPVTPDMEPEKIEPEVKLKPAGDRGDAEIFVQFQKPVDERIAVVLIEDKDERLSLQPSEEYPATFHRLLKTGNRAPGKYKLTVKWFEGEKSGSKELTWNIPKPTIKEEDLSIIPEDGSETVDVRQAVAVYFKRKPESMTLFVDEQDVTDKLVYNPNAARYFPDHDWETGEHTITVTTKLKDGSIIKKSAVLKVKKREQD